MEENCFRYKTLKGEFKIPLKVIYRFKAAREYTIVYYIGGSDTFSKHLKKVEKQLDDFPLFFRTDKSNIINMIHIKRFENGNSNTVTMKDDFAIKIARRRKKVFVKKYYSEE